MANVSVAMCTFNGEHFLPAQLRSIRLQTRPPDELIVCDDGSSDTTPHLLEEFSAQAPFPVRIIRNKSTLGVVKNFEQAIQLCAGELIAFSDQDDVWQPERLARSEEILTKHPEVGLVFTDAELIDEHGSAAGGTLWERCQFTEDIRRQFLAGDYSLCVRMRFVTGATVVFRSSLRDKVLPVGQEWIHDEWLAAAVPLFADVMPISEPLIQYRTHALQAVGVGEKETALQKAAFGFGMLTNARDAERHWKFLESLLRSTTTLCAAFKDTRLSETGVARLETYRDFVSYLEFRLRLPANRLQRIMPMLRNASLYWRFAGQEKVLKDLFAARR